jgi:hypothetical protein
VALALWRFYGETVWVEQYFRVPGAILLVLLAGVQLWFSVQVCGEFEPGEPILAAWQLIAASAAFDLTGSLAVQVLGVDTALNPLSYLSWWSKAIATSIVQAGHILGGPCRFILLAAGLVRVLKLYRESGFMGRLRVLDWALLAGFAAYCVDELGGVVVAVQQGKEPAWSEVLRWPVDPILCLLLAEALLLHRSVERTGPGLIGRCWGTYSCGIVLVLLGDVASWATSYGYLPWPWSAIAWYVWAPAAAAFALAPAYQLEAIRYASSGRSELPS